MDTSLVVVDAKINDRRYATDCTMNARAAYLELNASNLAENEFLG